MCVCVCECWGWGGGQFAAFLSQCQLHTDVLSALSLSDSPHTCCKSTTPVSTCFIIPVNLVFSLLSDRLSILHLIAHLVYQTALYSLLLYILSLVTDLAVHQPALYSLFIASSLIADLHS